MLIQAAFPSMPPLTDGVLDQRHPGATGTAPLGGKAAPHMSMVGAHARSVLELGV